MVKHVDSGGQVHLVTNIRKPRKWRRYEYLESNGTLYIDTNVNLKSPLLFKIKLLVLSSDNIRMVTGSYYDYSSIPRFLVYVNAVNNWSVEGINNLVGFSAGSAATLGTVMSILFNTNAQDADPTIYMFARNNDIGNTLKSPLRIYEYQIYQLGNLLRNFVPAQYNGQYGMWDLVEDKFYKNAGTGTFTVGPEMKNYDEIYEVRKTSSLLPAGVELYDYILSSGTLYIDTKYVPNSSTTFAVDMCILDTNGDKLNGLGQNGQRFHLGIYNTTFQGGVGNQYNTYGTLNSNRHSYVLIGNGTIKIDNNAYTLSSTLGNVTIPLFIVARNTDGVPTCHITGKFYGCTIQENSKYIRNFLPCTYLGEPGMWDTVENKFYRNQGTGLFTLGNKITLKEYEYLENTGESYIDTGFKATNGCIFDFEAAWAEYGLCMVGSHNPSSNSSNLYNRNMFIIYNGNKVQFNKYGSFELFSYTCSLNTKYHIYFDTTGTNRIGSINGNEIIRLNNITAINPINNVVIFYEQYASLHYKGKIYTCKLYNSNNQLVRDFIPVSYNGTPGLWDKVEWKFYANAGSGSFTLGPEKKSGIYPVSYLHDRTIYEEPDGSKWIRIVHHNNPSVRRFNLSDSFTTYVHTSEDLWFDASWCNTLTRWELMVKQKPTSSSAEQKYRWVQNVNPMIATFSNTKRANVTYNTSSGYTTPESSFGGLYRVASLYNYLNGNNNTDGNWWGSIGNCTIYSGGLPGWNTLVITTGYEDLYVRIA